MTIEITERTIGLWHCELPDGNWLAHLEHTADGRIQLTYRVRWYRDDKLGPDSEDIKNWYSGTMQVSEADAIAQCRAVMEAIVEAIGGAGWELLKGARTLDEFLQLLQAMPNMHTQTVPAPPADAPPCQDAP